MPQPTFLKKTLRLTFRVLLSLILTLGLSEFALRVFPLPLTGIYTTFRYAGDPETGYRPLPFQVAENGLECLQVQNIRTNSEGMRGAEWKDGSGPKIALLGDSYLLAVTVSDRWHVASRMAEQTGAQIWNAGVSGYGTYQELLIWRKLVKPRKPDITVLFFYLENDVRENACQLCRQEGHVYVPCLEVNDGIVSENQDFEHRQTPPDWKTWMLQHCYTWRVIHALRRNAYPVPTSGNLFDRESFAYNVYRPDHSPAWTSAWKGTEWALNTLKQECDSIGSRLVVVLVPGMLPVAPDWRQEVSRELGVETIPQDLDLSYPTQRIRAITDSAQIPVLDLLPAFLAYRDRYGLGFPYFGWCCDGHWNPIAHQLVADEVQRYLLTQGWLEGPLPAETPAPKLIVGDDMMEEIYSCGKVEME